MASLFLCCSLSALSVRAVCSDPESPLAALIAPDSDSPAKTPLILIHGIHGTSDETDVTVYNRTWDGFQRVFGSSDAAKKFSVFVFQYCSDRKNVSTIAEKLRDMIDRDLADRQHVLVAHSMGGLVAKSYMAEARHQTGSWKGKKGGETTLGLITLATPHHGTPGANDSDGMKSFVPDKYETVYRVIETIYWRTKEDKDGLTAMSPDAPNRADLRWDNFDNKLDRSSKDINTTLAKTNEIFAPFMPKLIAYAGFAETRVNPVEIAMLMLQARRANSKAQMQHNMLTLANVGLVNGLGKHFGDADGMVPYTSALFCRSETGAVRQRPKNYVCLSVARVRRFETGETTEEVRDLPDKNTLSIVRAKGGFDHLDMLENEVVLKYVVQDLATFLKGQKTK